MKLPERSLFVDHHPPIIRIGLLVAFSAALRAARTMVSADNLRMLSSACPPIPPPLRIVTSVVPDNVFFGEGDLVDDLLDGEFVGLVFEFGEEDLLAMTVLYARPFFSFEF